MTKARMVITISREEGSGGDEIAQALAQRLKLTYVDKEIIEIATKRLGLSEIELAQYDEKVLPRVEEIRKLVTPPRDIPLSKVLVPDRNIFGGYILAAPSEVQMDPQLVAIQGFHSLVEQLIKEIATHGYAVIVGRAANLVLKGWSGVVNVFIRAPLENRIEKLCYLRQIDRETAASQIKEVDEHRTEYVRYYYGAEWSNPDHYQLVINTATTPLEAATAAICQFTKEIDHTRTITQTTEITRTYGRLLEQTSYSLKEAAELLLISPDVLRNAVYQDELEGTVINHKVTRINREALIDWIKHSRASVKS